MRSSIVMLLFCSLAAQARADGGAHTQVRTYLRSRSGTSGRIVAWVAAGKPVRILERKGPWLKVKAGHRTGWLVRSTVKEDDPPPPPETPKQKEVVADPPPDPPRVPTDQGERRRRWTDDNHATLGAGTRVVVIADDAQVFDRPRMTAQPVFTATNGDVLALAGRAEHDSWLLVQNPSGRAGWIPAAAVRGFGDEDAAVSPARFVARGPASRPATVEVDTPAEKLAAPRSPLAARLGAAVGVTSLGMDFSSDGKTALGNYRVSAPALAVATGGELEYTRGRLRIGADGQYRYTWASPGIRYIAAGGAASDVPFSIHALDAAASAGYVLDATHRASVSLRMGYHYEQFAPDSLMNAALLPRESLAGLTTGALLDVARLSQRISLRASIDVLSPAERQQTPGQQDGPSCTTLALWAALGAHLALPGLWTLEGGYRFGWAQTDWNGMSTRQPGVTWAHRTDEAHTLTFGLSRLF